ncbi:MAG: ATP-binding protein [Bacteroidia bacterium]|nr:ATP-binding protein [Bacteroidia bacterium]
MKIIRIAEKELLALSKQYRAIAVVGPRQSGKTTLVRGVFPEKVYVNLENTDTRRFAIEDPRGFLSGFPDGAILDEVQRVPELFSYLQQILDENTTKGQFILTGSINFLLQENISQTLAGRVGYMFLLPLSLHELNQPLPSTDELIHRGLYPELNDGEQMDAAKYYSNYIRTYVERDVRLIKNIVDLYAFERFVRLCAGRTGQLLNMNSLAIETGVDNKTIASWLSVLETSFIVFRLQPYHKNYNKRIVKMPKLYFYDTGLASALLGIENKEQLSLHPFRGALFENMVVLEFLKNRFNHGKTNNLFFWRDNVGTEIDLLIENTERLVPIEIKSGQTITDAYFKSLTTWCKISGTDTGYVIYTGNQTQKRSNGITVLPYTSTDFF